MAESHDSGCRICGKPTKVFVSSERTAKYCSVTCKNRKKDPRERTWTHTCVQCGETRTTGTTRAKSKGLCRPCGCKKAALVKSELDAIRRIARGKRTLRLDRNGNRVYFRPRKASRAVARRRVPQVAKYPKRCDYCGVDYLGHKLSRYCGQVCASRSFQERRNAARGYTRGERSCLVCGVCWLPVYGDRSHVCSDECRTLNAKEAKNASKRKYRAQSGSVALSINAARVFLRDGWRCRSCGCDTPRTLRGTTDDNAPELDHIIPVSKGGTHVMSNLQCLCRLCNMAKGDKDWDRFHFDWVIGPWAKDCHRLAAMEGGGG